MLNKIAPNQIGLDKIDRLRGLDLALGYTRSDKDKLVQNNE